MTEPNAYQIPREAVQLGSYRVLAELARGGMAAVFLALREPRQHPVAPELMAYAHDPSRIMNDPVTLARLLAVNGDVVAIKQIHPHLAFDPEFVAMLVDEARIASQIHHPNVVELREYKLGDSGGANFLAMEYVAGESLSLVLKGLIARNGRMSPALAASIGADVAAALHTAHELRGPNGEAMSLVHRDISPQNIIVTYDGRVKLTDFGVAKAVGRLQRTQPGEIKGKLAYMAPEQAYGRDVDRRSDVYSLGVVIFELALGRRLFGGRSDAETIRNIMQHTIPQPRSIDPTFPAGLEEIILGMLKADPAQRFQSAGAVERALRAFVASQGGGAELEAQRGELVRGLEPERYRAKTELLVRELVQGAATVRAPIRSNAPPPNAPAQQPHGSLEETELSMTTPSLAPPRTDGQTRAFDANALLNEPPSRPVGETTVQAVSPRQRPATYAAPAARKGPAPQPVGRDNSLDETWRNPRNAPSQAPARPAEIDRTVQFDPSVALGTQGANNGHAPPGASIEQTYQSPVSQRPPNDPLEQTTPTMKGQAAIERTVMAAVSPDVYARMVDNARGAPPGPPSYQGQPPYQGQPSYQGNPSYQGPNALPTPPPRPTDTRPTQGSGRIGWIVGAMLAGVVLILLVIVIAARLMAHG